ncbi:hypothetical protein [Streptomyces sp. NPDC088182]|uniref:hypothetical protein n=1 Tax=Streptomyces sp. NPDC088182 TaxID=3365838 RepID=UPI0038182278
MALRDDHPGVIGLGPAVCEHCLFARLFDPDGEHHCTGTTTAQVIACVVVPSAPEACPCPCQKPDVHGEEGLLMTAAHETPLPGLPAEPIETVTIPDSWNAVTVPSEWAGLVLGILGPRSGAVLEDAFARETVWFIPPGGAADWPETRDLGLRVLHTGHGIALAGPDGFRNDMTWLRSPLMPSPLTACDDLRAAIEHTVGPLDQAAALGPVRVCRYCGAPVRDAHLVRRVESLNAFGWATYACGPCWNTTARGGTDAVQEGPR